MCHILILIYFIAKEIKKAKKYKVSDDVIAKFEGFVSGGDCTKEQASDLKQ